MFKRWWKKFLAALGIVGAGVVLVLRTGQQVSLEGVPTVEARMSPTSTQQPIANAEDTTKLRNGDEIGMALVINGTITKITKYRMTDLPEGSHATATMYLSFPVKRK